MSGVQTSRDGDSYSFQYLHLFHSKSINNCARVNEILTNLPMFFHFVAMKATCPSRFEASFIQIFISFLKARWPDDRQIIFILGGGILASWYLVLVQVLMFKFGGFLRVDTARTSYRWLTTAGRGSWDWQPASSIPGTLKQVHLGSRRKT